MLSSSPNMIDIVQYRDFYDVPRMFCVYHGKHEYLFVCEFDQVADNYADFFTVYEMPASSIAKMPGDWGSLDLKKFMMIKKIPVVSIVFDSTKRKNIDQAIFKDFPIISSKTGEI